GAVAVHEPGVSRRQRWVRLAVRPAPVVGFNGQRRFRDIDHRTGGGGVVMRGVARREGRGELLAVARLHDRSRGWSVRKCPRHIRRRVQLRSTQRGSVHNGRRIVPAGYWINFRPARRLRRREQTSGRDDLLGLARTGPKQFGDGATAVLIIFDLDVVPGAGGQRYWRAG